ncbi:MAG: hypothetical protein WDA06_07340 [Phenylobacterium sp.]
MNWYKIAKPIMEDTKELAYYDIGHKKDEKIIMFLIDRNFRLHEKEIINPDYEDEESPLAENHSVWINEMYVDDYLTETSTWMDINNLQEEAAKNIIATGRYDPKKHTASVIFFYSKIPFISTKITISKISKILDRKYNNPKIVIFK